MLSSMELPTGRAPTRTGVTGETGVTPAGAVAP